MPTATPDTRRLGIITTLTTWGGSEELWLATALEAAAADWEVLVWGRWGQHRPAQLGEPEQLGIRIVNAGLPFGYQRLAGPWWRSGWALRTLSRFSPRVVCVSQGGALEVPSNRAFAASFFRLVSSDVPYVVVCQLVGEAALLNRPVREMARRFFSKAAAAVFVAEQNRSCLERHLAMRLGNAIVLPNLPRPARWNYVPWPTNEPLRLACVGRLHPVKGQAILLEALSNDVWRRRPWELSLYGSGPDAEYLVDLARYFGIEDRTTVAGFAADVREIWRKSHLLVLASRSEGAPLAIVEAMLCGRPTVATDVGGVAEWVTEGETGFIAAAPTTSQIAAALERAWDSRMRWREMGLAARERALRKLGKPPELQLLSVLEHVCRNGRP